jgi:hypothetical protein
MALGSTASTRNISWGVKADGAIVLKSGTLNLLEPSGPVQACTGIDLTLVSVIINGY